MVSFEGNPSPPTCLHHVLVLSFRIEDEAPALVAVMSEVVAGCTPLVAPALLTWGCLATQLVGSPHASFVLAVLCPLHTHALATPHAATGRPRTGHAELKLCAAFGAFVPLVVHVVVHFQVMMALLHDLNSTYNRGGDRTDLFFFFPKKIFVKRPTIFSLKPLHVIFVCVGVVAWSFDRSSCSGPRTAPWRRSLRWCRLGEEVSAPTSWTRHNARWCGRWPCLLQVPKCL
jgi:hypothetical protein